MDYNLFGKLDNCLLVSIGSLDLEFLYLAHQNDGNFNEKDIEKSELKRLGVGRVLDAIASLKERNLISQNDDNTFSITNTGKHILWNDEMPLSVKILRLLEIKAFSQAIISKYLNADSDISQELETLRKNELILMSPQRTDKGLEKMYEILPAGIEELEKINSKGVQHSELILEKKSPEKDVFELLDEIKKILETETSEIKSKNTIIEKINQIKSKLQI